MEKNYSKATPTKEEFIEAKSSVSLQTENKPSVTKLWETIIRTNRLPDGVSEAFLYDSVREKLRDPEREVRQHVLRVLKDLIPVTQPSNLDAQMQSLLPEILKVLNHSSPSLRKSALDTLKEYLKFSRSSDHLMKELLVGTTEQLTTMAPFLINPATDDKTVKLVIDQLWKDLDNSNLNQEDVAKALARLRYNFGDERFKNFIGSEKYHHLQEICETYGLPIDYSDGDVSDNDKLWSGDEVIEDRVILETEITLRTGPAITMKIHEESRPNSGMEDSVEDNSKYGVIKVFDDENDSEFEEVARRTPRKVRFGGESVKLRTPESDTNSDDTKSTLSITVTDAVSITTKKSLIPIRITSLPSTPLRSSKKSVKHRLYRSAPNLSRSFSKSKLPVRRDSNLAEKFKEKDNSMTNLTTATLVPPSASTTGHRSPVYSPVPPHKSIELFHNLTRSPTRQKRPSSIDSAKIPEIKNHSENGSSRDGHNFNSFLLYPTSKPKDDSSLEESNEAYDSFKVCQSSDENKSKTSSSSDIKTKTNGENSHSNKALQKPVTAPVNKINEDSNKSNHAEVATVSISQLKALEYISSENNDYDSFKVYSSDTAYPNTETSQDENVANEGFDFKKQWQIVTLTSEENFWNKSEALDNLIKMLKQPNTRESLEPGPASLLFEALFACQSLDKLHFLAEDALALMVEGVRPQVLYQCLGRLSIGLCKIGAPSGVSLALLIVKKCPPKRLLAEVMDRCFAHKTREGALQLLMASARLFPRNEMEVQKMTEFAAATLRDRRRKVRHATLETLATLAQLSSTAEVLDVVARVTNGSSDHQYLLRVLRTSSTDFEKADKECQADEESAADVEEIRKFRMGLNVDSPKLRKHMFCMSKKLNMVNENAEVNEEVNKKLLQCLPYNEHHVEVIIKKCSAKSIEGSKEASAFKIFRCFQGFWHGPGGKSGILPQETLGKLDRAQRECQSNPETAADIKDYRELLLGVDDVDTPQLRKLIFCMNIKAGVQNEDGEISEEFKPLVIKSSTLDRDRINNIFTSCATKVNMEPVEAFALRFFQCLRKDYY